MKLLSPHHPRCLLGGRRGGWSPAFSGPLGFTLIEVLLVVITVGVLMALTLPIGINFYRTQQLNSTSQEVIQALRKAQLKAISQERDSDFGVYFNSHQYLIFKGSSYQTRDTTYDELFKVSQNIFFDGISEIVFGKLEGLPSVTGNIILRTGSETKIISINKAGRINLEL